jgi:hypothetical protein
VPPSGRAVASAVRRLLPGSARAHAIGRDGHDPLQELRQALARKEREGATDRHPHHSDRLSGGESDALQQRDRLFEVGVQAEPAGRCAVEPAAAPVPVEDGEVVFEGQELAVSPALVQERETGSRLNDEERWQPIGGRLEPDMLIPVEAWHRVLPSHSPGHVTPPEYRVATRALSRRREMQPGRRIRWVNACASSSPSCPSSS